MDLLVIGFIALQALALGIAVAAAIGRGRSLDRLREATDQPAAGDGASGADRPVTSDELERRVREIVGRMQDAEFLAAAAKQDTAYLVELTSVGIVRLDDRLVVEVANAAAHTYLDRPAGSMLGRPTIEAFIDPRLEDVARSALESGASAIELTPRSPDGPVLIVRARRSPTSGVWMAIEDVTELRRLQRIRTEFIGNLSHELRTPLTTVSLLAETLSRDAEAAGEAFPARVRDRIAKIEVETGHLVQMVNELLDLARIESGGPILLLDDVDLGALARSATERLRLFAERQGVQLDVEVAGVVPRLRGDERRLGQVLVNLLHNAVKFSPDGGPVTVRVACEGDEVVVSVEDRGIGIPRADLPRVFERFYKVDKARARAGSGTGLGLAIARHVVTAHGGRIWVRSEEGRGATFSFALPLARETPDSREAARTPGSPPGSVVGTP